jgi:hypothetical protein
MSLSLLLLMLPSMLDIGSGHFCDSDAGCTGRAIQKIVVRSGETLDGYQLTFTDSSTTPWRGGHGGTRREFVLAPGELQHGDYERLLTRLLR